MAVVAIAVPLTIAGVVASVKHCYKAYQRAKTNKDLCTRLGMDLGIVAVILSTIDESKMKEASQRGLRTILLRLQNLNNRIKILFEQCERGKLTIKIKKFLRSTSIRDELTAAIEALDEILDKLCLLFVIVGNDLAIETGDSTLNADDAFSNSSIETDIINDYYLPA